MSEVALVSPFTQYFHESLKASYVVACRTTKNLDGIKSIMLNMGYTSEELDKLFILATMSVEDISEGAITTVTQAMKKIEEHELSCTCPRCVAKNTN